MSLDALLVRMSAAVCVAMLLAHLYFFWCDIRVAQEKISVGESLRKLSALTIRNFPDRNLNSQDLFWKSIGREGNPMRDAWGTPYHLQWVEGGAENKRNYAWSSAGPDRVLGTKDDIRVEVPYVPGFTGGEGDEAPNSSSQAPTSSIAR